MGCGSSVAGSPQYDFVYVVEVNAIWVRALETIEEKPVIKPTAPKAPKVKKMSDLVIRRSGWKTVRVFVSSTFKDFHAERDILVKKVFPDLRLWCESRRLHLVECDLRWGVPKDATTEETLRTCLSEIDRCYQDNTMPFFLNMTSHRTGWIPNEDDVPGAIDSQYNWVSGMSVTEMEIMHGAFRKGNPNALFMLRDPSFLKEVPEEFRKYMEENEQFSAYKLDMLKKMIRDRFNNVVIYKCHFAGVNEDTKAIELEGLEQTFSKSVYNFFKKRIEAQYPLPDVNLDLYQVIKEKHESFMKSRGQNLFGRDDILKEIQNYVSGPGLDIPLLIVGGAGSGKSSIMARLADTVTMQALHKEIPGGGSTGWHVFYHFVGALPGSTELLPMLQRLLKEMRVANDSTMPKTMDEAAMLAITALTNVNAQPTIIIIDALNQLDEDKAALLMTWLPRKLAPQIRCIFSMIPETPQHNVLISREPSPKILEVKPLDVEARKLIVQEMLALYNKRLDEEQMDNLLSKTAAQNPLWLSIACEELRVFGSFRQLNDKINQLADGLLELEGQVMERFERESGGGLVVATLCLLETSVRGLLETELLSILADEDNLIYPITESGAAAEKDDSNREKKAGDFGKLPAYKWAAVYIALRPFIRPFGDSGEGRLDFYHRSLSKAVRKKYLSNVEGSPDENKLKWWHGKLADFFENSKNADRKFEEYPEHLAKINDMKRLQKFLSSWNVIEAWVDDEFSYKLIKYWRMAGGFEELERCYINKINNSINKKKTINHSVLEFRYEKLARIFSQTGRWDKAREMVAKAQEIEENKLGSRPERLLEIHHLTATIEDEELKLVDFMYRSQLPQIKVIIDGLQSVVDIAKTLKGDRIKFKLGIVLNRLSFHYTGWSQRGGNAQMSKEVAREKAVATIDEAIAVFKELKDEAHVGDCITTRGVCEGRATAAQIKYYNEAREILIRSSGELNSYMDRLLLNMAIYYEEMGDYYQAYDFFYKWYDVGLNLFGINHPKTGRCIKTLQEPMYRRIAAERKQEVPEFPAEE